MAAKGTTYLCKHCDCLLLKKAYERHKLLYYDEEAKQVNLYITPTQLSLIYT